MAERAKHGSSTISLRGAPRPLGRRHRLVVWGEGGPRPWPLPPRGELTVGRDAPADIRVDAPAVSRPHARLLVEGGEVRVEDLGSRNGTRVNGERLDGARTLAYGDVVAFGDVLAVFEEQMDDSGAHAVDEIPLSGLTLDVGDRKIVVADPIVLHIYTQIRRLAESPLAVLVVGETGTGKDLAASALHAWSKRRDRPFVSINCAALPETLAESELFGHERGAFSGAARDKAGLLESASGGTVFLDEIGDLPLPIQPKLLRALESQRVTRLGAVRERPIDVRLVTATHRDLRTAAREGSFRQDLYFRLSAAVVQLPALRDRPRELPLLARRFLDEACLALGRPALELSDGASKRLAAHAWPGNVRELKNLMGYFAAIADGSVGAADVDAALARGVDGETPAAAPRSLRDAKNELERREIADALAREGGNKTRAARALGMPLRTLMWKLKRRRAGAEPPDGEG